MTGHELMKPVLGALVGAVVAWSAHSFTMEGELRALGRSLDRIEARLDRLETRAAQPAPMPQKGKPR